MSKDVTPAQHKVVLPKLEFSLLYMIQSKEKERNFAEQTKDFRSWDSKEIFLRKKKKKKNLTFHLGYMLPHLSCAALAMYGDPQCHNLRTNLQHKLHNTLWSQIYMLEEKGAVIWTWSWDLVEDDLKITLSSSLFARNFDESIGIKVLTGVESWGKISIKAESSDRYREELSRWRDESTGLMRSMSFSDWFLLQLRFWLLGLLFEEG